MNRILAEHELVIEPTVIEFTEEFLGDDVSHKKVTFHNRGKRKLTLKILRPYSWVFQIDNENSSIFLSPGLSVSIAIHYKQAYELTHESNLPFVIDNKYYVDIPIRVKRIEANLTASPLHLNFGIIDLGCRFVSQYLTLSNSGSCPTKFAIDFGSNKLDLLATPKQGQIAPYGTVSVKIEMAGFITGELFDEFWVKGEPPARIEVEVHVLFPYFHAIHPNTTGDFTLINFEQAYYGTERYETFVVQNVSSFPSCFVVLAEMNDYLVTFSKAQENVPAYRNFSIHPVEGSFGPFEGQIFTIKFHPCGNSTKNKGWKHLKVYKSESLSFLRVLRVGVVEWDDDHMENIFKTGLGRTIAAKDSSLSETNKAGDMLRVCVHGEGIKAILTAVPDSLRFEGVEVGKVYRKVIRLTNSGSSLSLGYRFKKCVGFYVTPEQKFLKPKKSFEITISFKVASLAYKQKYLKFEVISFHDLTDQRDLKVIDELNIGLSIRIKSTTNKLQPKFNLGITPFIAHETGIHTELIKYKEIHGKKPPKMLLIPNKKLKKYPWLDGDSLVAYPNDMPHSLRTKKHDPNVRAIFTGKKRYVPPIDTQFAYTEKQSKIISEKYQKLRRFNDNTAKKIRKALLLNEKIPFGKRSYSDERLEKVIKLKDTSYMPYKEIMNKNPSSGLVLLNEICPLTPTHLYNIRVMPKTLDFGKIPPNIDCVKILRIDNFNNFPVTIKLLLHKAKMKQQVFSIAPRSRNDKEISLNLKYFGKYYSNISYVVNNNHSFDLKISANVIQRTLSVMPAELILSLGKNQFEDIFQMKWDVIKVFNPLYVPTNYEWIVPSGLPITIEPMKGKVPGNRSIACVVYFDLWTKPINGTLVNLIVEDGHHIPVRITMVDDKSHNVSYMVTKRILPPISLNLSFLETVLLFNAGFKDAVYSVTNPQPLEGVTVRPIIGIIPARACIGLSMDFTMTSIAAFAFHLSVELQNYDKIKEKFIGHVVYPKVECSPKTLALRSTPCFSHDTYNMQIENKSPAVVQVQFPLKNYPQIKISYSKKYKYPGIDENGILIEPKASKDIFLHFIPNDLATYDLLLPIILNKIIGPPLINNEDSQKPESYITISKKNSKLLKYYNLECPTKVTSIYVDCSVAKGYLEFSQRHFIFNLSERKEMQEKSISLKNITNEKINFFFDISALILTPFTIISGPVDPNKMMCLEPNRSTIVTVKFEPLFPNVFESDLPLFLKEFSDKIPYTFISLKGTLPKSTLYCATSLIQFLPVPTECLVEWTVEIIATHQYKETQLNCFMRRTSGEYQEEDVFEFIYPKGNKIPKNHAPFTIPVLIRFKSKKKISCRRSIAISDEQDGQCLIQFTACADNAVMSTYIYIYLRNVKKNNNNEKPSSLTESNKNTAFFHVGNNSFSGVESEVLEEILDYPKFPKITSSSSYACYMRRVLKTMEQWLFEQGFNGSYRMVIGDHVAFSKAYVTAAHSRSKSTNRDSVKSIIDLLFNLIGRNLVLQYQLPTVVPDDDLSRIGYCLAIYKQVLQLIMVQGGNVSHIFPIYLLHYEDYVLYMKSIKDRTKNGVMHFQDMFEEQCTTQVFLSEEEFKRYNLQGWLDIIIQIHRTITEAGIPHLHELKACEEDPLLSNKPQSSKSLSISNDVFEARLIDKTIHLKKLNMERTDKVLLTWLNVIYKSMVEKETMWQEREINYLDEDLKDGVALAAVTLFYCPYLKDLYFEDFYFNPEDQTQYHHNGVVLATAWDAIRLGITVMPSDFYNYNPIFIMILVCHLYLVLRSYIPQASIQFLSCLSHSVTRKISVRNSNTTAIGYSVKILGDTNGSFSVEKSCHMIVLSPKSSVSISLSFIARKITPVKAILVLSGTCLPSGYANNMVFNLDGEPFKLVARSEFVISTPIYKPTFINANVLSPYDVEGEYEVWYTEEEPQPGKLNTQKWSTIRQCKTPRMLHIGCNHLSVPPSPSLHPAVLPLTVACYSLTKWNFWIILTNQEIGDFIVKILIKPRIGNPFLVLPLNFPEGICTGIPNARCSPNCPRKFKVNIPCRSSRLWTTVKAMFFLTLETREHEFWEHHLETRIGLDLIKWMLGDKKDGVAAEIGYLFNSKVKYKVTSQNELVETEPNLIIEDVHSPGFVQLMAHVCCMMQSDTANIMLESECGKEIRHYQIRFSNPKATLIKDSLDCRKCVLPSLSKMPIRTNKSFI